MWRRRSEPLSQPEPVRTDEILNGIIETLMRIDANVQLLLHGEEDDGEEED
jgi:hypothetical protein